MNVLLIDMFGNALDMACVIGRSDENDVSKVFVMADRVCPNTWAEKGVEVVVKQRTAQEIAKFVQVNDIKLVCNFDPLVAELKLAEFLSAQGVDFLGADAAFARTEMDRLFFKNLLINEGIKTPEILFRGSEQDVLKEKYNLVYPLVLKPSLSLVSPEIVYSYEELEAHFNKVRKRIERTGKNPDWLIEKYIDAVDTLSVNYIVGKGEYKVRGTYRIEFVPKTDDNLVGATSLTQPHPKESEFIATINKVTSLLADQGYCGFGFFQALVDKAGDLYVIENNARPISCGVFDGVERDVMPLIRAALHGGLGSVGIADTYEESLVSEDGKKNFFSEGLVLQHTERARFYSEEKIKELKNTVIPFSMRKVEGGYLSEKILPPSVIVAVGPSKEAVSLTVAEAAKKLAVADER